MNATHSIYKSERGAALLIALFVLVIVSVMGITAMKTSMFSAKIATVPSLPFASPGYRSSRRPSGRTRVRMENHSRLLLRAARVS